MNERIQELAYDAEDYADTMVDGGSEFHPVFVKKFAELIVQECMLAVSKTPVSDDEVSIMVRCHEQIEKHFGVEEK